MFYRLSYFLVQTFVIEALKKKYKKIDLFDMIFVLIFLCNNFFNDFNTLALYFVLLIRDSWIAEVRA